MRIPRLFHPQPLAGLERVLLSDEAFGHAVRVLRLREGDPLRLFDGSGGEYTAELERVERREAWVRIGAFDAVERESPLRVWLGQGLSRGERMEIAIQKAVELGVSRITPLQVARSVVRLDEQKARKRQARWNEVAVAACEQSGRNRLPTIDPPQPLGSWLTPHDGPRLLLDPADGIRLADLSPPESGQVSVLVGPEGGLDETERALARQHGWQPVRLGPRVLRTETAPLAILAALQVLWGDL